jgi:Fe2+ transport system protein B
MDKIQKMTDEEFEAYILSAKPPEPPPELPGGVYEECDPPLTIQQRVQMSEQQVKEYIRKHPPKWMKDLEKEEQKKLASLPWYPGRPMTTFGIIKLVILIAFVLFLTTTTAKDLFSPVILAIMDIFTSFINNRVATFHITDMKVTTAERMMGFLFGIVVPVIIFVAILMFIRYLIFKKFLMNKLILKEEIRNWEETKP